MIAAARIAQAEYEQHFGQDQVDEIIRAAAHVIYDNAEMLAKVTVEETEMGVYEDKVAKNRNKSKGVWYNLRGKKSMGIIGIDDRTGLIEIAKPIGVVAGITPMTNPVVTPMSKIIFALKTKNAIIIAPTRKQRYALRSPSNSSKRQSLRSVYPKIWYRLSKSPRSKRRKASWNSAT